MSTTEAPAKILVVDDDEKNVKLLEALLVPSGYEVVKAYDGGEALHQAVRERPDLVLLDVMMPAMDGFEVCKRLKNGVETRLIPVVIMTALGQVEDRIRGIEAGADGFLTKPVHRDELMAQIRTSLRMKQTIEREIGLERGSVEGNVFRCDIFLSYATEDRSRTRILVQALESHGWSVWWDRTIPPGQTFDSVIERALDDARCAVVLWSKVSVTSDWVKTEAAEAARRRILVPVLIDDVIVPFEFRRIQAARLVGWAGDQTEEEFGKLVQVIAERMGQPPPDVRAPKPPPEPPRPPPVRSDWRRPALLGSAGALAIVLGFAAYMAYMLTRPREPLVIGVMDIHRRGNVPAWMCDFTRESLNTVLSKAGNVRVFARQAIDLKREKRGLSELEAAQELGIAKMVSGTISQADQNLMLEVEVVDIKSGGMLEGAERTRGNEGQLIEMQNQAAIAVLKTLKIDLSEQEVKRLVGNRTNDQLDEYKLLTESMGGVVEEKERPSVPPSTPQAPKTSWRLDWPATAYAEEGAEQAAVQQLLERYRTALESKNMEQIAAIYVEVTPSMRDALTRYFATADSLKVSFSNFDILIEGNEAVATFTRNDEFKDAHSGRDMHLEVRVSSVVAKQDGGWKIRGLRKPS